MLSLVEYLSAPQTAIFATLIVLIMFWGFINESYAPEMIALLGAGTMLVFGFVDITDFQSALSNTAPWTIAAMFVLSAALVRTGVIVLIGGYITRYIKKSPYAIMGLGALMIILLSAFMNNTPVVVIMIPIVLRLANELDFSSSKFMIPLSYFAILGGMLTLLGTSTNLLIDGIVQDLGLEGFRIFEVTPVAIFIALWGFIYIFLITPRLLPSRSSMAELLIDRKGMSFFTEVAIPEGSSVIGRDVLSVELFKRSDMRVIDVLRGDESLRRDMRSVVLEAGDRIVLRTGVNELLGLKESRALTMVDQLSSRKTTTVEALVSPECSLIGRRLGELRLRRRYGVYPLAVHRRSQNLGRQMDDVIIRVGDTLLLEGTAEDISRLSQDVRLLDLSETEGRSYRRRKAPITLLIWVGMLLIATFGITGLFEASILAVLAVLAIRAIDLDEAINAVHGELLLLIISMLIVGQGLMNSGAIQYLADYLTPILSSFPPFLMIWIIVLLTSLLTEMLSNNAVAVIMTPIAITLAAGIGVDPRPCIVAVMIGASSAFSTPIGYQTNMLVYGPGGYEFKDFMRAGIPLNISVGLLAAFLIPYFFPL